MDYIPHLIIQIPPLLLALTLHEFAHAYVANRLGDPTAERVGRLSLNPLRHLDPIGTLAFVFIKIGWAKPVPVNPVYFRNPRKDMLWVSLAGPLTNLLLAVISAVLLRTLAAGLPLIAYWPPLQILVVPLLGMLAASVWINLILCIFNLLPIPPLDGSKILSGLLPEQLAFRFASLERYGFFLILLLAFTGVIGRVIIPIIDFANRLLLA